jgi:UDP-N-acetylglucosamine--N-acetylmuramyl-(pentapeptide) pyrophosphoryl-undecaprenol N-acetylglucosamine transferase
MPINRIIISGGGTGGHVFPAIAIADAIKAKYPNSEILFVGAKGKLEITKVPEAGYKIVALNITGLQRSLSPRNLMFPFKLIGSLLKAFNIVKKFKPDLAIGVGGYASGPTLMVCSMLGIPTFLQEQNSYPGITNKLLAKKATKIYVAYQNMQRFFENEKIVLSGNPIRKEIEAIAPDNPKAHQHFDLDSSRTTILIIGGSLGARTINESVALSYQKWIDQGLQIIWQTGKSYTESITEAMKQTKGLYVTPFIRQMNLAYAAADLVVSRAGAISVSELCVVGKPTIFIPSPNVSEDHQTKNAMALVNENASLCIKDSEARETLGDKVLELINEPNQLNELSIKIKSLAKFQAAENIVDNISKTLTHKL